MIRVAGCLDCARSSGLVSAAVKPPGNSGPLLWSPSGFQMVSASVQRASEEGGANGVYRSQLSGLRSVHVDVDLMRVESAIPADPLSRL